jgi:uncharacterized protein YbjQ (UPF0145 family)
MAPVVSDPWADLREDTPNQAASKQSASQWGASRRAGEHPATPRDRAPAESIPRRRTDRAETVIDLTQEDQTGAPRVETRPVAKTQDPPVVDLGRRDASTTDALAPTAHYGLGSQWGSRWATSTQGWVKAQDGTVVWRPIVTTTEQLDLWDIDRYLGIVTAEVAATVEGVADKDLGVILGKAREIGVRGLVEEAIERGAHGVIGVTLDYTPVGSRLIITMTGTAVTLREKRS